MVKRNLHASIALGGPAGSRVIYENLPYKPACDGKKMHTAFPFRLLLPCQAEEEFVHESCRLQSMAGPLVPHVHRSQALQFAIDKWRQLSDCMLIAARPGCEQPRHFTRCGHAVALVLIIVLMRGRRTQEVLLLKWAVYNQKLGSGNGLSGFPP